MNFSDIQVDRNLTGMELEKKGQINDAVLLYEENVEESFEGDFPYERLAIIYHKRGELQKERNVLEKAIYVFENIVYRGRTDRQFKLDKFKSRLSKL